MTLNNYNNIRFSDFETTTNKTQYYKKHNDTRVNLWVYDTLNNNDDHNIKVGTNIKDFINTIIDDVNSYDGDEIIIYFHNLPFDGRFIYCYGVNFLGWKFINKHIKNNKTWCVENNQTNKPKRSKTKNKQVETTRSIFDDFDNLTLFKETYGYNTTFIKFLGKEKKPNGMLIYLPNGKRIRFKCSLAIIPMSLEQIGKSINIAKHNEKTKSIGFYDIEPSDNLNDYPKDYIKYAIRDVSILKKYFKDVFIPNMIKQQQDLKIKDEYRVNDIPSTIASYAFKLQLAYLKSSNYFESIDEQLFLNGDQQKVARNFYLGGLTLFNPQTLKQEYPNCCYIDINSSYPFSMTQPLPYGYIITIDHKNKESNKTNTNKKSKTWCDFYECKELNGITYLTYYEIYVKKAKIKNPNGLHPLQNWKQKIKDSRDITNNVYASSCISTMYCFYCYYLDQEWELMKEFYDFDYEITKTYYIKAKPYLKDYINTLYETKANAKTNGDRNCAKLLLNSSYGKWGENQNYNIVYFCANDQQKQHLLGVGKINHNYFLKTTINKQGEKIPIFDNQEYKTHKVNSNNIFANIGDNQIYPIALTKTSNKENSNPNVWVASTITSYSRIHLLKTILKCDNKNGNVLYCDTDSLILKNDTFLKNVDVDDKKLGAWKIEKNKLVASIFGKKMYKLVESDGSTTYKIKGVSPNKDIKAKTLDALMNTKDSYVLSSKLQLTPTKNGWVLVDVDVKLNTNPITSQIKNIDEFKKPINNINDPINDKLDEFMHSGNQSTKLLNFNNVNSDVWDNLKVLYNNYFLDLDDVDLTYSIEFEYNKPFTFDEIKAIILGSINNYIVSIPIENAIKTNLIDVLNNIYDHYKNNVVGENKIKNILDPMLTYTIQNDIFSVVSSREFITIVFEFSRNYKSMEFYVNEKIKHINKYDLAKWLIDKNIFQSLKDVNDYLFKFCGWK